ncbi:sensor histidine kinase [Dyella silvatica]|uniref:sensor histidine kinase n=1 Tax=Dyella silvatica TaxID=2992128 RepID=UPI0022576E60|nr:ATP-binding protein [Dyella silvatica]
MSVIRPFFLRSLARRMLLVQLAVGVATYLAVSCIIAALVLGYAQRDLSHYLDSYAHSLLEARDPALSARNIAIRITQDPQINTQFLMRFRLVDGKGQVLAESADAPQAIADWKLLQVHEASSARTVTVAVKASWLRDLWLRGGMGMISWLGLVMALLLLPAIVLATIFLTRLGLRPLRSLISMVGTRSPANLTPLQIEQPPAELLPLIDELNRLIGALHQAQLNERQFFQDAAQELLTPLAVVQAQAHVLATSAEAFTRSRAQTDLQAGLQRVAKMIRQLLTVAKIHSDDTRLQLTRYDLIGLLSGRISVAAARAHEKRIELSLLAPERCSLVFDYDMLTTVIDNLLDNALKYIPQGGSIKTMVRHYRDAVWLVIADDGPGIAEAHQQHVLKRFYRVPGNRESGSGLGLAIVQRIVELHGGSVSLRNGENRGLMVCLRFALDTPANAPARSGATTTPTTFDLGPLNHAY